MAAPAVVVVGGGLAGISAAIRLREAGLPTQLIEARRVLGGRVRSFGAAQRDNGQHVFLGCCSRLLHLLDELDLLATRSALQSRASVPVVDWRGKIGILGEKGRLGSLSSLWSLASYGLLTPTKRASLIRCMARLRDPDCAGDSQETFDHWLRRHGQGAQARRYFWDLFIVPTLNAPPECVSAAAAAFVLRTAFFSGPRALRVGWARQGLTPWLHDAALARLQALGVRVRLGERVGPVQLDEAGAITGIKVGEQLLETPIVVLAVPPHRLPKLLPPALAAVQPFEGCARLATAAIIGVHLRYATPTGAPELLAAPDSPVEWIFNRTRLRGESAEAGEELSIVLSHADRWLRFPNEEIVRRLRLGLARTLPATAALKPIEAVVHREPRATFVPSPRTERWRPAAQTPVPGLILAGAWTQTGGWPATMEGAVISGENAAAAVLAAERVLTR